MSVRRQILERAAVVGVLSSALVAAPVAASGPAPDRAAQQFEIKFMERTIEHHMMGVEMAELCVEKTTAPPPAGDATLVETCETIAADQSAEAEQLRTWLRDWYGIDFEPKMSGGMLNQLERLSGEDFDIAVSEMFIKHHLRQIKSSTKCLLRAEHEELQQFCQHTIDVQSADIVTFQDILREHGEEFRGA
jgi:uncharacterized protein (DUF305 family)